MAVEIRTLDPDDLDQLADLGAHSFGGPRPEMVLEQRPIPPEEAVAAYDGDRLVGHVAAHRFRQWFGGRAVPCGGVAGVMVMPDQRGSGLAARMMAAMTEAMRERGDVVSALYPTTASLYRSVGYEVAGWWGRRAVDVAELAPPAGDVTWRRVEAGAPEVAAVYERCARGRDGWVVPTAPWWVSWAVGLDRGTNWVWIGDRESTDTRMPVSEPVAVVAYGHAKGERRLNDLDAHLVAGIDGPALAEALAFLGSNGTTADRLRTTLPGPVLARHVAQASRLPTLEDWPWMLRLIDLPGAIAARGWPAGLALEVTLRVSAPARVPDDPAAGDWTLRVAGGGATCEPAPSGESGAVEVAVGDLAALYSGHLDPAALVDEGRLRGATPEVVSGLRAAFAGSPTLPIFF